MASVEEVLSTLKRLFSDTLQVGETFDTIAKTERRREEKHSVSKLFWKKKLLSAKLAAEEGY
jgi:hypothetical protein